MASQSNLALDAELLQVLRRGHRLRTIVRELPPEVQWVLVRRAGETSPSGSDAALTAGLAKLYGKLSNHPRAAADTLALWLLSRRESGNRPALLPEPLDWRYLLDLRLRPAQVERSIPAYLVREIDRILSDENAELSSQIATRLRRWEAATLALEHVARIEAQLESATVALRAGLSDLQDAHSLGENLSPERWALAGEIIDRLHSAWRKDKGEIHLDLESLAAAAKILGADLRLPFSAERSDDHENVPCFNAENLADLPRLRALATQHLLELEHLPGTLQREELLELASKLSAELPARDAASIRSEEAALRMAERHSDLASTAPILCLLYKAIVAKEPPSDSEFARLEEELTARTLRMIPARQARSNSEDLDLEQSNKTAASGAGTESVARDGPGMVSIEPMSVPKSRPASTPFVPATSEAQDLGMDASAEEGGVESVLGASDLEPGHTSSVVNPASKRPGEYEGHPPGAVLPSQRAGAGTARAEASEVSLFLESLRQGNLVAAYWLARALAERSPLPLWLVELLQLSLPLRSGHQRTEDRLRTLFSEALEVIDDLEASPALLVAASCVRPALISPTQIYPVAVTRRLAACCPSVPGLVDFLEALAAFAEKGKPVSSALLSGLSDGDQLQRERKRLEDETEHWLQEAPLRTVKFQSGTLVWKSWTAREGRLRELVKGSRSGKLSLLDFHQCAHQWLDRESFIEMLDDTQHSVCRRPISGPIRHGAMEALHRLAQDAIGLASRWQEYQSATAEVSRGTQSFELEMLRGLKSAADALIPGLAADDDLGELDRAARQLLLRMVREIASDFTEVAAPSARDPLADREQVPLLLPEVDPDVLDQQDSKVPLDAVIRHLKSPLTLESAALEQLRAGRIAVAQTLADAAGIDLAEKGRYSKEWNRRAKNAVDDLGGLVEQRKLQGVLGERDKVRVDGRIEELRRELEQEPDRPDRIVSRSSQFAEELSSLAVERTNALAIQLEVLVRLASDRSVAIPPSLLASARDLLNEGSLDVVSELVAELRLGVESGRVDADRFVGARERLGHFEAFIDSLPALLPHCSDARRLRHLLDDPKALLGVEPLDPEQKSAATEALVAWQALTEGRRLPGQERALLEPLIRVLRWLGFQLTESETAPATPRDGRRAHFRVFATLGAPIPRFGSLAGARHEVVLSWSVPSAPEPESIAHWIASTAQITPEQPVTLLCLWPLDSAARRRWIHAVRGQRQCVLLIDSCLMAWLSRFGAAKRTAALFAAALPGGYDNPYMPEAAGGVAPEVFFGRSDHVERLWRPDGPCVVFGGRQLGKSALLRQVVRRFHEPEEQRFVLYEGLSHQTDLFELFRSLLLREGLLKKQGLQGTAQVKSAIASLLRENPQRRILILLDECDRFLTEDAKSSFQQVSMLRDLMTETDRRFKAVFAGLHSVQRFQRVPNQPLAHFGEPLCVGPLEPPAGRDLVQVPFEALGYRFEPPTLINRILAHTNSHPSLVQLFCRDLMDKLLADPVPRREQTPPFTIDDDLIARVYQGVKLGEKMRARFDWTLDLDPRYRLLGYVFAFLEHEGRFLDSEGAPAHEILDWAGECWPEGFGASNTDELIGLLEEIKGLGILAGSPARGYRLRSPNLLRLLGTSEEVQHELASFVGRPYSAEPEPNVIRRIPQVAGIVASPLTLDQEGRILARERGLDLIVGSQALALNQAWPALKSLAEQRGGEGLLAVELREVQSVREAVDEVKRAYADFREPGLLVHVDPTRLQPEALFDAINELAAWLSGLTHENRFLRIVTTLGPSVVIHGRLTGSLEEVARLDLVSLHRLRRWKEQGLRQWLHDAGSSPQTMQEPVEWLLETGGWPALLEGRLRQRLSSKSAAPEFPRNSDFLHAMGLDEGTDAHRLLTVLAQLDQEIDLRVELPLFAADLGLEKSASGIADALFDLDLLVGAPTRARPEPLAARLLLQAGS